MVYTDKSYARDQYDIVVRAAKYPTQGEKLLVQKGTTKISVSYDDVPDLLYAIGIVLAPFHTANLGDDDLPCDEAV